MPETFNSPPPPPEKKRRRKTHIKEFVNSFFLPKPVKWFAFFSSAPPALSHGDKSHMRDLVEMTLNLVGRDYDEAKTLEKLAQDATQALGEKKVV